MGGPGASGTSKCVSSCHDTAGHDKVKKAPQGDKEKTAVQILSGATVGHLPFVYVLLLQPDWHVITERLKWQWQSGFRYLAEVQGLCMMYYEIINITAPAACAQTHAQHATVALYGTSMSFQKR